MAHSKFNLRKLKKYQIFVLFVIIIAALFFIFKDSIVKYHRSRQTREIAQVKLASVADRLGKAIRSVEEIPKKMALVLEFSKPQIDHINILLNSIVKNNNEVFGACVAFEPYKYKSDIQYCAPYIYTKEGKTVSVDPLDSSENYFTKEWYLLPKLLNKPVWIEPYFDEGSGGGNIIMATYSVPFYTFDGSMG